MSRGKVEQRLQKLRAFESQRSFEVVGVGMLFGYGFRWPPIPDVIVI